jgi:cyclopropane-fatty-acyl-phospholipid synthase
VIYKFKSQSEAEVIMLGTHGDQMLKIMGREPSAQGILTVAQIPAAVAALQAAVVSSEAVETAADEKPSAADPSADDDHTGDDKADVHNVSLRARVTPLVALLRNSALAGEDVTWGV